MLNRNCSLYEVLWLTAFEYAVPGGRRAIAPPPPGAALFQVKLELP
jgi:hypothetical protein